MDEVPVMEALGQRVVGIFGTGSSSQKTSVSKANGQTKGQGAVDDED